MTHTPAIGRREAVARLTTHGKELYGADLPISLTYTRSTPPEFVQAFVELGCEAAQTEGLVPTDHNALEVLEVCEPHGPAILTFVTPDAQASAGMALVAMLAHARASPEVRGGVLHRRLMAGLLSDGAPTE